MGVLDSLKASGYVAKPSQDGIFEPYKGTYKVAVSACRKEADDKGVEYIQVEYGIQEVLLGTDKRNSKYADFRKRYYLDGEKATDNMKAFLDDALTFGIDLSQESDESLESRFPEYIGKEGYIRAWGWLPDGADKPRQMTAIQQEKVALKAKGKATQPF